MVDSAEETYEYSIPLPDLGTGKYEARWRASAAGVGKLGPPDFQCQIEKRRADSPPLS